LVGEIDFENFVAESWFAELPIVAPGRADAVMFWFELDLDGVTLTNSPTGPLRCVAPAFQYLDSVPVDPAQPLSLEVKVTETRLHFRAEGALQQVRSSRLPSWYIPMLLDKTRNEAYRGALERALAQTQGQTVLDIGAGCGLLSMMAAQANASRVIGCEVNEAIAKAGRDIVQTHGMADRIALLDKDCRDLKVGEDGFERADLAVFELFDCSLIGEGVLHLLAYAREHLLKKDARLLPMAAKVHAMLVEHRLDRVWDVDANLLNPYRFSPAFINVDAAKLGYRALSAPIEVFSFDFATARPVTEEKQLEIPLMAPGIVGAVLFWFDLQLDETTHISNAPGADNALHWKQGLQFLPELQLGPDRNVPVIARHDGSGLRFHWKQDAVPADALVKLPRFDPRAHAAAMELEQQTRSLLQHCGQAPDEHAKVVDLANRFAVDPGAHQLDPTIARRFAATFYGA
jgi:hypothetical protein